MDGMRGRNAVGAYRSLNMDERLQIYYEVLDLRRKGISYRRIQEIIMNKYDVCLNISTMVRWMNGKRHPLRKYNKLIAGPELAYTISAWIGDGSLGHIKRSHQYVVLLSVKDYDFAEEWGRCAAKALGRDRPYRPEWNKSHQRWVTRARSRLLYDLLKSAKGDPWILLPYLEKHPGDACRGFFDAEGGANPDSYKIVASNTDVRIIRLFKNLLEKISIQCSIYEVPYKNNTIRSPANNNIYYRNKHSCFWLVIHGKENILKFAERVGFTIARKRARLTQIIQKYNRIKIYMNCLEKFAKALVAANLVRLGLVRTQTEAAMLTSISQSSISDYLRDKRRMSKLLMHPDIERLSREYINSRGEDAIIKVQKVLQAIIEMYN